MTPGGPAAKAGLETGDVITEFDGETITSPDDLTAGGLTKSRATASASRCSATVDDDPDGTLGTRPSS